METRAPYVLVGLFVLAVIGAVFGFVYWLHNTGGLTERTVYRVQFENTVSGLLSGAAVLFNGIRVGEVTALNLDPKDSKRVTVTIAVASDTPVRADTKASLDFQGLTGVPVVILEGGSEPLKTPSTATAPYTLMADPAAGQSMTAAARDALRRVDSILSDNADPLRKTIANLQTFSDALARNSDKVDNVIKGLERMTGGPAASAPRIVYDLQAPKSFPPLEKVPQGLLAVADPTALIMFESRKIMVRPDDPDDPAFAGAEWGDSIPKLVQSKIIQSFENAGLARTVVRPMEGVTANRQLLIDIRKFQLTKLPRPSAEVEFQVKILSADGKIEDARVFQAAVPAKAANAADAVAAINEAFGKCATDLVVWAEGVI